MAMTTINSMRVKPEKQKRRKPAQGGQAEKKNGGELDSARCAQAFTP
jgi:hypothetical protein